MENSEIMNNKKRTSYIKEFIFKNKIISLTVFIFFMCFTLNAVLIYNFMMILAKI